MKHILDEKQRSQALIWYAVLGFDLQTIADHYGITVDQIREELETERDSRHRAGKSPDPVPVRPHLMEREPTHADVLMDQTTALQDILLACKELNSHHAVTRIGMLARDALLKAGIQP